MTTSRVRRSTTGQRVLPTERINVSNQLALLDAVVAMSDAGLAPVTVEALTKRQSIGESSVAESHSFMAGARLLESDRSVWTATAAGRELARLRSEDAARARMFLRKHWNKQWFTTTATRLLARGPLEEQDLILGLSRGLSVRPARGAYLIEWMTYALIVQRDEQKRFVMVPADGIAPEPGPGAARAQAPQAPPANSAGLLIGSCEEITALPDARFLALMDAYRTVLTSLVPDLGETEG